MIERKRKGGRSVLAVVNTDPTPVNFPSFPLIKCEREPRRYRPRPWNVFPRPKLAQFGDPDRGGKKRLCGFSFPFFFQKLHHQSFDGKKITNFCHRQILAFLCRHHEKKNIFLLCFFRRIPCRRQLLISLRVLFPLSVSSNQCLFFSFSVRPCHSSRDTCAKGKRANKI